MAENKQPSLAEFVSSLGGGDGLRVEETLGSGYVRLRVAEAERRQAKHDIRCVEDAVIELLRNSRDAGAAHVFVGISKEGERRSVLIADDGSGIPRQLQQRVFDARVTSKLDTMSMDRWGVHGRGMALYSIRENAAEARVVASDIGRGAVIKVVFNTDEIPERADQSTWPEVVAVQGSQEVRGPRNIIRTCVEFALESRESCKVYVGSPSELIATMRARISLGSTDEPMLVELPGRATEARSLREAAESLGVVMSERTAHRIVRGDIKPLRNAVTTVMGTLVPRPVGERAPSVRRIGLTDEDRAQFVSWCTQGFEAIAQRYYVELVGEPRLRVADGKVTVTFEYRDED